MSGIAFFSGDGAVRRAQEWCDGEERPVLLDWSDFLDASGGDKAASAAACAAAARSFFSAGYDVAICGEDYDLHFRRRLGPLMEASPRTSRRIEGGGIVLRAWEAADVPWVHEVCQDPEIARWTNIPWPYGEDDARSLLALSEHGRRMHTASLFAVAAPDGDLLGSAGLTFGDDGSAEVGYWMAPAARGRGAATAAVKVLTAWALGELGLARVVLRTMIGNTASERVAQKAGFEREGVQRAAQAGRDGGRIDLVSWSRTAPPAAAPAPGPGGTTPPGPA